MINNPQTHKEFPFDLWDFQEELLETFESNDRVIILKPRQIGVSWLISMYSLHLALFENHTNVLIIAQNQLYSQRILQRVKFINDRLPEWLSQPVLNSNLSKIEFKSSRHESVIQALPATEDAGRSETATLVICDEWAYHPYARKNWEALAPTIEGEGPGSVRGRFIGISTANGLGNFYYENWKRSEHPGSEWKNVFLPFSVHPARREKGWWEEAQARWEGDPKKFPQEYPRTPQEAFVTSGGCIFDMDGLLFIAESLTKEPLKKEQVRNAQLAELLTRYRNEVRIWSEPRMGIPYVIGADSSGGHSSDWSVATVFDGVTREHVATMRIMVEPGDFAAALSVLAQAYNYALIVPERNNHGSAVLLGLQTIQGYGNIYRYEKDRTTGEGDNQLGWPTNPKTKLQMVSVLQNEVRHRSLRVFDMDFVQEAQAYIDLGGSKVGAEEGMNDDIVTSVGLSLIGLNSRSRGPQRPRRVIKKKHFVTKSRV